MEYWRCYSSNLHKTKIRFVYNVGIGDIRGYIQVTSFTGRIINFHFHIKVKK